jgi:hypothetical protein
MKKETKRKVSEKVVLHLRGGVGQQRTTPTYSWDQKNANKILFQIKIEAMMTQERATSNDSIAHCPLPSDQ